MFTSRYHYPMSAAPIRSTVRILGIDPGLRRTGWGVIACEGNRLSYLACGSVETSERAKLATRLVAITWVHSSTGVRLPVREITDAIAEVNAERPDPERILVCLDGVHGFAAEDATPDELGIDFLVTGTHKWLFGPRGTGLIWGREEAWSRFTPIVPSFIDSAGNEPGPWSTPGGYHSFEHRWALAEAFELHLAVGARRVAERTRVLAAALHPQRARIPRRPCARPRRSPVAQRCARGCHRATRQALLSTTLPPPAACPVAQALPPSRTLPSRWPARWRARAGKKPVPLL